MANEYTSFYLKDLELMINSTAINGISAAYDGLVDCQDDTVCKYIDFSGRVHGILEMRDNLMKLLKGEDANATSGL